MNRRILLLIASFPPFLFCNICLAVIQVRTFPLIYSSKQLANNVSCFIRNRICVSYNRILRCPVKTTTPLFWVLDYNGWTLKHFISNYSRICFFFSERTKLCERGSYLTSSSVAEYDSDRATLLVHLNVKIPMQKALTNTKTVVRFKVSLDHLSATSSANTKFQCGSRIKHTPYFDQLNNVDTNQVTWLILGVYLTDIKRLFL